MDASTRAIPLMGILYGLSKSYGKRYCFPSQKKILELLKARFKIGISIASINRWLRVIEDAGYIKRTRRIRRDKKLGMVFQSTLYTITWRGYRLLVNCGIAAWNEVKNLAAAVREKATRPRPKKAKKTPGVSDYFLPGSGLLEDVSKKPT
jgi:DNA-binding transcriptional ArsR family regulator